MRGQNPAESKKRTTIDIHIGVQPPEKGIKVKSSSKNLIEREKQR